MSRGKTPPRRARDALQEDQIANGDDVIYAACEEKVTATETKLHTCIPNWFGIAAATTIAGITSDASILQEEQALVFADHNGFKITHDL
ncbi:hypothetical protein BST61_g1365 [Cercospora zeina]